MDRQLESGSESFSVSDQPSLNFSPDAQEWKIMGDARAQSFTMAQDTVNKEFGNLTIEKGASARTPDLSGAGTQSSELQNENGGAACERSRESAAGAAADGPVKNGGTGARGGGGIGDRGAHTGDGRDPGGRTGVPRERSSEQIMEDLREFLRSTRERFQPSRGAGADDSTATIPPADSHGAINKPDRPPRSSSLEASSGPDEPGKNSRPNDPPPDRAEDNDRPANGRRAGEHPDIHVPRPRPARSGGLEGSSGPDEPDVNSRPNNPPPDRAEDSHRPAPGGREVEHPDIPAPRPSLPIEDGVPAPQPGRYVPAEVPPAPMPGREGDGTSPVPWPELPVEEPGRHKPWDVSPTPWPVRVEDVSPGARPGSQGPWDVRSARMPGRDGTSQVPRPMRPIPGWRRGVAGQGVDQFGS